MDHLLSSVEAILKFTHGRVKENRMELHGIFSRGRPPAERHQVHTGANAVTERANFRCRVVVPSDRHLHDFPAHAFDEEQYFEIETEALCALHLKGAPRCDPAKQLQATLRIAELQP